MKKIFSILLLLLLTYLPAILVFLAVGTFVAETSSHTGWGIPGMWIIAIIIVWIWVFFLMFQWLFLIPLLLIQIFGAALVWIKLYNLLSTSYRKEMSEYSKYINILANSLLLLYGILLIWLSIYLFDFWLIKVKSEIMYMILPFLSFQYATIGLLFLSGLVLTISMARQILQVSTNIALEPFPDEVDESWDKVLSGGIVQERKKVLP